MRWPWDVGEALGNLADAIRSSEQVDELAKLDGIADINSMQDQLAKIDPNKSVLRTLWNGVEKVAKAAGVVSAAAKVRDLLASLVD
jgi:hypothetical protein